MQSAVRPQARLACQPRPKGPAPTLACHSDIAVDAQVRRNLDAVVQALRDDGAEVEPVRLGWTLTYPFNLLGPLPVLAVPSGVADNGVPTGVQIVARPFDDARVFEVGAALERARPWDYRRLAGLGAAH